LYSLKLMPAQQLSPRLSTAVMVPRASHSGASGVIREQLSPEPVAQ